jgi:hypothetical protein
VSFLSLFSNSWLKNFNLEDKNKILSNSGQNYKLCGRNGLSLLYVNEHEMFQA